MFDTARKETLEALVVGVVIACVALIAEWLIDNDLWRTIVLSAGLLVALIVMSAPHISRVVGSFARLASIRNFHARSSVMHNFIHDARDLSVRILGDAPEYAGNPESQDGGCLANRHLSAHRDTVISLLEHVVRLFESLVASDVRVWACIRDRRADDRYYTFARAGQYNPNRKHHSTPLHKTESKTLSRLRDSFASGSCVIITGSAMGPQMWEGQRNDQYEEDKSVLMGAVLSKSLSDDSDIPQKPMMAFVIGVCANKEGAFEGLNVDGEGVGNDGIIV
ncbi:MAG: hypothetical protein MI757_10925, partial [Pirellulales bacterium]|nr:hypothetical protein [Pirellulales bacterium]